MKTRVVSVNFGLPAPRVEGHEVTTRIFKAPVEDRVTLGRLNLDGVYSSDRHDRSTIERLVALEAPRRLARLRRETARKKRQQT